MTLLLNLVGTVIDENPPHKTGFILRKLLQ